jgi:hypothetical protein
VIAAPINDDVALVFPSDAVSVALAAPTATGAKATATAHEFAGPSGAVHVFARIEKAALLTDTVMAPVVVPPKFVMVIVLDVLVVFTPIDPKSRLAGVTVSVAGATAVPLRAATARTLPSPIVSVAAKGPAADGANLRAIVQVAAGASAEPTQVLLVTVHEEAAVPEMDTVRVPVEALPVFVTLTVEAAETEPTETTPKLTDAGVTANLGADVPMPVRLVLADVVPAVTIRVAAAAPVVVGLKETTTVQLPLGASPDAQLDMRVNEDAEAPLMVDVIAPVSAVPLLVTLRLNDDVVPVGTLPKSTEFGEIVSLGAGAAVPVPDNATVAVAPPPLTVRAADAAPALVGAKVTAAIQPAPCASPEAQLEATTKEDAEAPEMANVSAPVAEVPLFVMLRLNDDVVFTGTLPKSTLLGDMVNLGADASIPMPVSATVATESPPVTVSVADRRPSPDGLKVTAAVQMAPGARGEMQVFVTAKQDAAGPVMEMSRVPALAVPPLRMVILAGSEVVPVRSVPRSTDAGDTTNDGRAAIPVPLRGTVDVMLPLLAPVALQLSMPRLVPADVGAKLSWSEQVPAAPYDFEQVPM